MAKTKTNKVTQKTVTDWIYKTYDISFLPKYFFMNLSKISKGKYKGLNKPVAWVDLLDMWQRKMPYLEKVHIKNEQQGKHIEGMARINYDLAIILSKYDNYLAWKSEQEAEKIQKQKGKQTRIDYSTIDSKYSDDTQSSDGTQLDDILNDLWIGEDNGG